MTIDHVHCYGHFVSHIANDTEVAIGDIQGHWRQPFRDPPGPVPSRDSIERTPTERGVQ